MPWINRTIVNRTIQTVRKFGVSIGNMTFGVYEAITEHYSNSSEFCVKKFNKFNDLEKFSDLDSSEITGFSKKAIVAGSAIISNPTLRSKVFQIISQSLPQSFL